MPKLDYIAAVTAVLAAHFPEPEMGMRGIYICPTCTREANDTRDYPCAVVKTMEPYLPLRIIAATHRRRTRSELARWFTVGAVSCRVHCGREKGN